METIITLGKSKARHWGNAFVALLFTTIGSFFPIWGGAIVARAFLKWSGIAEFIRHGELAIYSATFLTMAVYIIAKGPKKKYSIMLPMVGLLISALIFAVATSKQQFDELFVINVSSLLLIYSLIQYFFTILLDMIRSTDIDPQGERRNEIEELSKKVDMLGKTNE